jgi:hypothetical protein
MKGKFAKLFGVAATLALLMGLFVSTAPVSAAPGENEWDEIDLPPVDDWAGTDIGVMAIAPDGTMFASVWFDGEWDIVMSTDGGFTWDDTTLTGLPDGNVLDWMDGGETPVDIVISPNWPDDTTVYVGILNGEVYRLGNAGEADPVKLIPIVDSDGVDLTEQDGFLYDLDIFWDGSNNWVAAATDLDVFLIRDALFESWRDFEMATETELEDWAWAVQVDFAPDFASSGVLWAIAAFPENNELTLSSTVSPGQWGNNIDEVMFENLDGDYIWWTPFVDIAFPDDYDSESAMLWVSIAEDDFEDEGNLFLVYGELVPGESEATPIFEHPDTATGDVDLGTVEVSGYNILVKEWGTGIVWRSTDGGGTFEEAERSPADGGMYWGHLYMAPGPFDADEGVAYSTGVGPNSALSRTTNGGDTWNQIAYVDTEIDNLIDMAFSPVTSSQPAYLITQDEGPDIESLWYTADATADDVQWVRIGTDDSLGFNHMQEIEFIGDSTDIAMFVIAGGNFEIWKSMNDADTWSHWRDVPAQVGWIMDFLMTDGTSIYAAGTDAFWGTQAFGPSNLVEFDHALHSVAVYDGMVAVGDGGGNAFLSDDNGETWSDPLVVGDGDDDNVYVTFGPDGTLYAAPNLENGSIAVVQMYDADEEEFVDVEADSDDGVASSPDGFVGIWASPDNTLYALSLGSDGEGGDPGTDDVVWVDDSHGNVIQAMSIFGFGGVTCEMADNSAGNEVTVLSGTFIDGEYLEIIGSALVYLGDPDYVLHGTIVVQGAESGAMGVVTIAMTDGIPVGGPPADGAPVYITGSTIFSYVEEGDAGTAGTPAADICLHRLLIGEDDSVWETACIDNGGNIAENLWGTNGSNILWTFTDPEDEEDCLGLWALEDFLTGAVDLVSPADGSRIASATSADLEWEEMDTADDYELGGDFDGTTDDTEIEVTGLTDNTTYEWKVRVAGPWTSRWSDMWEFTTKDNVATPVNMVPVNGLQDAPLVPSFMWSEISGATNYTFELATDPTFATTVGTATTTVNAYTWTGGDLVNDQDYYWRVRAYNSSTGGVSDWCLSNFHTRMASEPPVTVTNTTPPDVHVTTTVPAAETPAYIWIIIVIGAILTIAVIVLIVRTRRVV